MVNPESVPQNSETNEAKSLSDLLNVVKEVRRASEHLSDQDKFFLGNMLYDTAVSLVNESKKG